MNQISSKNLIFTMSIFWAIIVQSPLLQLFSIKGLFITIVLFFISLSISIHLTLNKKLYLVAIFCICIPFSIPILYWQNEIISYSILILLTSLLLCGHVIKASPEKFIESCSNILFFLLILCWIGFFLAITTNGKELFTIFPIGRDWYFFYTTFSSVKIGSFIRPSAIYTEPGHLIWITSSLIVSRSILQLDKKKTWYIAILSCITFSIAFFIFLFCYLLFNSKRKNLIYIIFFTLTILGLFHLIVPQEYIDTYIYGRFQIDSYGQFEGDNRSFRFENALYILKTYNDVFLFGVNPNCALNMTDSCISRYPLFGENPLTPLVLHGIFIAYWYYAIILCLLVYSVKNKGKFFFLITGIILIYLQQPTLLQVGYSFWPIFIIAVLSQYSNSKN